ncbi:penicillin-binding protein 1C [Flagellimonas halotolerans]|uniref:peptidoglycan glycosyltransferase n=1 Tax=Flagellimonas halotolerans TaxID=3112164 RepID=A0ABU6ITQ2_9FLAO|nr:MULTISPECIES: penicillin-binding protein 1C [unclassified Allomuricauda]MEC3966492.1 penicillin-binding protein 1C [Muricauda sp. SYSU M86414]MEC4266371.1 penicillin-binding protein 1C [Muricauda sp. SYSU M84420]
MKFFLSALKKTILKHRIKVALLSIVLILWLFCLPKNLFKDPTSTVVDSSEGSLIGARIADDGQWRFPQMDAVPERFKQSILLFEDEYFYSHPGFNPISIIKAIGHNLTKETRRGGSTITQQVIRLSRKNQSRTYWEKLIEVFMATRLELRHSKEEILKRYASHTPYGGNVVGLETAAWRYFGIPAHELSWGQSAALAVLPNAPALIFPGRNEQTFLDKRNRLLKKLWNKEIIDKTTYVLALAEPLPQKPMPLPDIAPHLTERIRNEHPGERITTSVQRPLQQRLNLLAERHYQQLQSNEIHNLAILVLDVETRKVLGYVGNSPSAEEHSNYVDIITKKRSTGSTLKPFLFASLLDEGALLPNSLVEDVPTVINGYNPQNFNLKHVGTVPASKALSRSLNVPAVRLLREYGLQKFYNKLQKIEMESLDKPASHYGLSLILGGAESSLWEVTSTYASMASSLNYFLTHSSTYRNQEFTEASYLQNGTKDFGEEQFDPLAFGAGAIYSTFQSMYEVNRPEGDENWQFFDSSQPIAWKTGTSFGFKDAWAVGVTPKYAIGVWAGNADGEGRPGLTGITAAAPLLFDVLDALPQSGWFQEPFDDLTEIEVCAQSGFRASIYCDDIKKEFVPTRGTRSGACPYHQQVFLDASEKFRVNSECYSLEDMVAKNWFVLPPILEYYYTSSNPNYQPLPPYLDGCSILENNLMEFIYPKKNEAVLLPKDLGNKTSEIILKLAHQQSDAVVYWYLDETFVGKTENFHELILDIKPSNYILTAVDNQGNQIQQMLEVRSASGE